MKRWIILATGIALAMPAQAFDLGGMLKGVLTPPASTPTVSGVDALSSADINAALKEALTQGADAAVAQLGQVNGFFGNPALKIPLPASLQKAEKAMRMFGMGAQADELVLSMNRAAEAAVPEAKPLLVDAVKNMTLEDATSSARKPRPLSPNALAPSSKKRPTRLAWHSNTTSSQAWPRSST